MVIVEKEGRDEYPMVSMPENCRALFFGEHDRDIVEALEGVFVE